jgi:Outer membrane protein beta-barrel domain
MAAAEKRMKTKAIGFFFIFCIVFLPKSILAHTGVYFEASGGITRLDNGKSKCNNFESEFNIFNGRCSIDDKGTQFSAGGGLRLGNYFELGARYEHIEKVILRGTGTSGIGTETVKSFFGPITGYELLGRLHAHVFYFEGGLWRWSADSGRIAVLTANNTVVNIVGTSQSDHAWSPLFGIGLHFALNDHFALRTGYTYKWVDAGSPGFGESKINERFHVLSLQMVIFN